MQLTIDLTNEPVHSEEIVAGEQLPTQRWACVDVLDSGGIPEKGHHYSLQLAHGAVELIVTKRQLDLILAAGEP